MTFYFYFYFYLRARRKLQLFKFTELCTARERKQAPPRSKGVGGGVGECREGKEVGLWGGGWGRGAVGGAAGPVELSPRVSLCTSGSRPRSVATPSTSVTAHTRALRSTRNTVAIATFPSVSTLNHTVWGDALAGDEAAPAGEGGCIRAASVSVGRGHADCGFEEILSNPPLGQQAYCGGWHCSDSAASASAGERDASRQAQHGSTPGERDRDPSGYTAPPQ